MASRIPLLLHMHQPDYRDPESGEPIMPWVRLHATRGYTDVAALAIEYGVSLSFNVVPSLLDQLEDYAGGVTDQWERLSRVPAEDLNLAEVSFIRENFFHGHPAMRSNVPRYRELEANRSHLHTVQDLRDLQVWSNLAWMGFVARRDPFIHGLVRQERGYTHPQLEHLMDLQRKIVANVLPLWRKVERISCTPYCHPILPLLVNFDHSRRALPDIPRSVGFAYPHDAERQLREGIQRTNDVLGKSVGGCWPSEGSVSPEVLGLAEKCGISWLSTDQAVLERSIREGPPDIGRAWRMEGSDIRLIFRDRGLSDRIGFWYASWEGRSAAADLLGACGGRAFTPLVLDGENPWESYRDAGEAFLRGLFESGRVCSMDEAALLMPEGRLRELHTGSWIGADFQIWAGDPMDRAGWRQLAALRGAYERAGCPDAAWPHIRAAEGSDWFWWYGPEHHTEMRDRFDLLFRKHLMAGWAALGQAAPENLRVPIWENLGE